MRVLVAPDKFRGTLTAEQAARAMAAGWRAADPRAVVDTVPMADGGEGTLDALLAALGGDRVRRRVTGPLGDPVDADYGMVHGPDGDLAVIEMARASGLALVSPSRRDPRRATTFGTGELLADACRRGARRALVCVGGSATNDAGAGMAQAVGVRLLDDRGADLPRGGAALLRLQRIDISALDPTVAAARIIVATDVDNPLTGPRGASAVYGPQKGASARDIAELDESLRHFAAIVHRDLGVDLRDAAGAGAAGGLGGGLIAFLGAKLRRGVEVVMDAVRFRERLEGCDAVVTGEGKFDAQSLAGKTVAGVIRAAEELRVTAAVVCGRRDAEGPPGVVVRSLVERFGAEVAMGRTRRALEDLTAEVALELMKAHAAVSRTD